MSDDVDPELVSLFRDIVKNQMTAAEKTNEMVTNYDVEEINRAGKKVANESLKRIEDDDRKKLFFILLNQIGQNVGSPSMAEEAERGLKEMVEGEGV